MFRDLLQRAAWIAAGAVLLALAWFSPGHSPFFNLVIPAGAWMVLRGCT